MEGGNIKIVFGGQSHAVDANTLISTLLQYNNVLSAINSEYGGGSRAINMKINAIEAGSFIIDVSVIENVIESIFSSRTVEYVASLATIFGVIFELYGKFKGKPIKDESEIQSGDKDDKINKTIFNTYNRQDVREMISRSFETINEDSCIDGLDIATNDRNITFDRSVFPSMIYTDFDLESQPSTITEDIVDAVLTIIGLKFENKGRWTFMWNGMKISMNVSSGELMKAIDRGERFGKGDALRVRMKITREYVTEYHTYQNKSYRIVEFIEHIKMPSEQPLL